MTFRGLVMKFKLDEGEQLKPLIALGYSKPTSKDSIVLTRLTEYGSIEVHKKDDETCMVLLKHDPEVGECVEALVGLALSDLGKARLFHGHCILGGLP